MGMWVHDARAELQALRGTGCSVGADVEKVQMLQTEERSYKRRLAAVKHLRPKGSVVGLVAELAALLPHEVVLGEVRLHDIEGEDRVRVWLAGWSPSEILVAQTLGALEASPVFDAAVLVESKPESGETGARRYFAVEVDARFAAPRGVPPTPEASVPAKTGTEEKDDEIGLSAECAKTPGR